MKFAAKGKLDVRGASSGQVFFALHQLLKKVQILLGIGLIAEILSSLLDTGFRVGILPLGKNLP